MNTNEETNKIQKNLENNKYTFELVNQNVHFAETKASILLTLYSIASTFVHIFYKENVVPPSPNETTNFIFYVIIKILCVVSILITIIYFLKVIFPNLIGSESTKNKYSIFFKDIASFSTFEEYYEKAIKADSKAFNKEILRETYFNSKICSNKMKNIRIAIISIIFTAFFLVLEYLICL